MGFIEMLTEKDTLTKNGAVTNSTSHNYNLDLFFLAGACRNESVEQIEQIVDNAHEKISSDIISQYVKAVEIMETCGEEYKNNPISFDMAVISVVQSNCATMLKEVICEVLNL